MAESLPSGEITLGPLKRTVFVAGLVVLAWYFLNVWNYTINKKKIVNYELDNRKQQAEAF